MTRAPSKHQATALYRALAWTPLIYLVVFGIGWLIFGHFFPPFSPADSAQEIADQFMERRVPILFGSVLIMVATMILMPMSALLVMIIRKIEGQTGVLTLIMAFTTTTYMVMNFFVPFGFALATFRPDRNPELVQFAGDFAFMQFMGGIPMFWMFWVVAAIASFISSRTPDPVFPRWFGYFNVWCALLYIPELLIFFFKTGPFAWDGVVGFWIPAVVFIAWFVVTAFVCRNVVRRPDWAPSPARSDNNFDTVAACNHPTGRLARDQSQVATRTDSSTRRALRSCDRTPERGV
ncbi:hypothetical protein [Rhodococcus tibetensis]|uniref:DUF4386 domain-containing protein n=1 Tax=Rhodococcus tibetensis TaxID=2965064 RepID=A0ABT1QGF6_9NOCA|nr:hypothetical protein [Rhodococcus sp. FXJ9.536]MCQ4121358.1 hypothetical protein [Rhodococcus sp. FXJ9.536]